MISLKCKEKQLNKQEKKFVDDIEKRVRETISKYSLLSKKDKIFVAVSGGKDSTTVLYILHKLGYLVQAITVDAHIGCYTEQNLENIRKFCKKYKIKLHEISFRKTFGGSLCYIRDNLKEKGFNLKSCTVCGVLRRYLLNLKSRKLKATKLVLGHNLDDEAQAIVMNFAKSRPWMNARIGPMHKPSKNRQLVPRIKPLYFVTEAEVVKYSKLMNFPVKFGVCPCGIEGFRHAIRNFLDKEEVKKNIIKAFLKKLPKLQKKYKRQAKTNICEQCEEPSSTGLCKACGILKKLKKSKL